jgi:putative RecB family exonuclease
VELETDERDRLEPVAPVREVGVPTPPPRLSPSGAGTFEQCPRRWRFRYVERLPDPPGEAALAGSFAHRVLEVLMQKPAAERTPAAAKLIARDEWPDVESDDDYQALGYDDERSRHFRWKAWQAIEGLWTLEDPTTVDVRATEQDVEAVLGGVPFRGIVDRLEDEGDGLVVTDYKSGKAPSPRYRRGRLDQVLLYAAAVKEATGEMPVRARLLYLGQRPVGIDVTQPELDGVIEKLSGTWTAINTACDIDEFEPRTGPLCGWCPYADQCPEGTAEVAKRLARKAAEEGALLAEAG